MAGPFADQVVIVTGASSGIGRELAREAARQGARVGLIARRKDRLADLAGDIEQAGGAAAAASADVGDRSAVREVVAEIRDRLGPPDLLIANAGVGIPTLLEPPNVSAVEKMTRVNFLGTVYTVEAVIPDMLRRSHGHLVAVSSLAAYRGLPGESGYCATKAAVNVYMEGLRTHLRGRGVRVTVACPGFVRTPMTEVNKFHMPWLLEADDAARRILRAVRRGRKVYNFPWQMALVMKATRWLPDWVLARSMQGYNDAPPMPADQAG